jgi:hypothetical protein
MEKIRLYKCHKCKELIETNDLVLDNKKDRKGNIKPNEYNRFHSKCYEDKTREWNEWCNLYEYVKEKYFNEIVPHVMIKELKELRVNFTFRIMQLCFESIENSLVVCVNRIKSDFPKCRYLMAALKNNIDGFNESQKTNDFNNVESETPIIFDVKKIDYSKYTDSNDFDILD